MEEEEAEETLDSTEARVLFKTEGDYAIDSDKESDIEDVTPDTRTASMTSSCSCNTSETANNLNGTDTEMEEVPSISFREKGMMGKEAKLFLLVQSNIP